MRGVRPVVLVPAAAVVAVQLFVVGWVVDVKLVRADADYGACFFLFCDIWGVSDR